MVAARAENDLAAKHRHTQSKMSNVHSPAAQPVLQRSVCARDLVIHIRDVHDVEDVVLEVVRQNAADDVKRH